MTYSRLRGHVKKYIENIEGLHRIIKINYNESEEIKYEYLNYSIGLWQASVEYDRELRLYESLVIRQPMKRIRNLMRIFENVKIHGFPKTQIMSNYDIPLDSLNSSMKFQLDAFKNISETIRIYWIHLFHGRYPSKLYYANMNDGVKKRVEQYITDFLPTTQNWLRKMLFGFTDLAQVHCEMYVRATSDPCLKAFYVKFYDHYNKSTDSEKEAMRTYFDVLNDTALSSMLVTGQVIDVKTCIENHARTVQHFKVITFLPKITLFKDSMKKMESFSQTVRLEGNVFRYFTIIS